MSVVNRCFLISTGRRPLKPWCHFSAASSIPRFRRKFVLDQHKLKVQAMLFILGGIEHESAPKSASKLLINPQTHLQDVIAATIRRMAKTDSVPISNTDSDRTSSQCLVWLSGHLLAFNANVFVAAVARSTTIPEIPNTLFSCWFSCLCPPRQERRRRSERLSAKEANPSDAGEEHPRSSLNSSRLLNGSNPHDDGCSEHQTVGVASSPPNLENAITARWFAADLRNSTGAAAVHDEVTCPSQTSLVDPHPAWTTEQGRRV